jgi:SAM-dependent methyltransferase
VELRATFGTVAEAYDRARPTYPRELFAELRELSDGDRLLEIGCGTGKATAALVAAGYEVTCVELSDSLAEIARRPRAGGAHRGCGSGAVAGRPVRHRRRLHGVSLARRRICDRGASLRNGGSLAVVKTVHVLGDDRFFVDAQEDYDAVLQDAENQPPPRPGRGRDTRARAAVRTRGGAPIPTRDRVHTR